MPKLTTDGWTDGPTDPNYRKASLLKMLRINNLPLCLLVKTLLFVKSKKFIPLQKCNIWCEWILHLLSPQHLLHWDVNIHLFLIMIWLLFARCFFFV